MSLLLPTVLDVRTLTGAEFETYTDPQIQREIDRASRYVSLSNWDERYSDGVELLAAHFLEMRARSLAPEGSGPGTGGGGSAGVGPKKWMQMGTIQEGYGTSQTSSVKLGGSSGLNDAYYATTGWGQEYLALRALIFSDRVL